jgi:hypothetical protein
VSPNSAHVCWLHHSKVYHRRGRRSLWSACGVLLSSFRFRSQEGTEHQAKALGLRRCGRCWRRTDATVDERSP